MIHHPQANLLPCRRAADDIAVRANGDLLRQLAFRGQVARNGFLHGHAPLNCNGLNLSAEATLRLD